MKLQTLDWRIQPPHLHPAYTSSVKRAPTQALVPLDLGLSELTGPVFGHSSVQALDNDLTRNARTNGEPIGERIMVTGRLLDERGQPVRHALLEVWQANAAGRYIHLNDQHPAPLDANFSGCGRVLTNDQGDYQFTTIKPGAYPWRNHSNAWRPAHIHFSVLGRNFLERMVTQMFFPNDPLLPLDPIYNGIPDLAARARLVSHYDHSLTQENWALGYRFDIVLAGGLCTPFERNGADDDE